MNKQRQRGSWAGLFPDALKSGAFLSLSNTFTASVASPKPSVSLTHKTAPFFPPQSPPGDIQFPLFTELFFLSYSSLPSPESLEVAGPIAACSLSLPLLRTGVAW